MSYHFVFGASGSGKSTMLQKEMTRRAGEALRARFASAAEGKTSLPRNYIFIVPEQYTLQTQKELVMASPFRGILNVDVLSFGRLTHRIFEESGADRRAVLGDMGKTLILRRLAGTLKDKLPVIGAELSREGYIAEVKSALSEFMQYGISPKGLGELIRYAGADSGARHGALEARLRDLETIYRAFLEYEQQNFVTSEETLDLVAEAVPHSALAAESVFVFDGFTGFTPVQARVIAQLMKYAPEVWISLVFSDDGGSMPEEVFKTGSAGSGQDLFYLTRKTVRDLGALAAEQGAVHGEDLYLQKPHRFADAPALAYLEKRLFRYPVIPYPGDEEPAAQFRGGSSPVCPSTGEEEPPAPSWGGSTPARPCPDGDLRTDAIRLSISSSPEEEVRQLCIEIRRLVETCGYCYRDIAVVAGDLAAYEGPLRRQMTRYGIPFYLDVTRAVQHNPLVEAVRGALRVRAESWSYSAVFHYLRSGLSGLDFEEIDLLENYCLRRGVRGRKRWETPFDEDPACEALRLSVLAELSPFEKRVRTAGERTEQLEMFLAGIRAGERTAEFAARFAEAGDPVRALEYTQIYDAVQELLRQIRELLGGEALSAREYLALLETGFGEIRLGTLPQQADLVVAGDLERTRLTELRALFVLGVNDGNIPGGVSRGGLLSDLDREFLQGSGMELAPTPRQQMYIQRLYLYLALTRPRSLLCLSCSAVSGDGKSLRPSYLMTLLMRLFPEAAPGGELHCPERRPLSLQLTGYRDSASFLADALRRCAEGALSGKDKERERNEFYTIYGLCASGRLRGSQGAETARAADGGDGSGGGTPADVRRLREAAFRRYSPKPLSARAARRLYGNDLSGSVSRLEKCADCYGRQYLQYGLRLLAREEYVLRPADTGTILHACLDRFAGELERRSLRWRDVSEEEAAEILRECLQEEAESYGGRILHSSARTEYQLIRMQRVLERSVQSLSRQLRGGSFEPAAFELSFGGQDPGSIPGLEIPLTGGRKMLLRGRIDRLDRCTQGDVVYVKVIDYKSGGLDLSPAKIREGRQLQLLVYMLEALTWEEKRHPGRRAVPAAMLYYQLKDPVITLNRERGPAGAEEDRSLALRPTGMLNPSPEVMELLENGRSMGPSSLYPVQYLKNGGVRASSRLFDEARFAELSEQALQVMQEMGEQILAGCIELRPYRRGTENACSYCPYKDVCGFDLRLPGYGTKGD